MTPVVSVVVPVYDRAHCIADAVTSVLRQMGPSLECIVADDESTDTTVEVVGELVKADGRVRLVEGSHGGPSAARNRGIAAARGELVTFHDSDDLMPDGRLDQQVRARESLGADGVFGRYAVQRIEAVDVPRWLQGRPDEHEGWSWTSLLIDRASLEAIGGFDEELRLGEDLDLVVRLREHGRTIAAVEAVWVVKRWFGDNLTYEIDEVGSAFGSVVRRHMARQRRR